MKRLSWAAALAALLLLTTLPALPAHGSQAPYHFGFKKSVNGRLQSINEEGFKGIVDKYGAVFLGNTARKELYLTFDNGYENGYTAHILDVLKEKKVPAIFFVTGHYVKDQPELLKRMAAEGHLIGNHSWSHPDMTQVSDARIVEELDKVKREVAQLTGQKEMRYLRPPRGIFNERTLAASKNMGYTNVFWSIAYKDWDTKAQRGSGYAFQQVTKQLHPGAVILLHAVSRDNAEALGAIIDEARKRGYSFASLDALMTAKQGGGQPQASGQVQADGQPQASGQVQADDQPQASGQVQADGQPQESGQPQGMGRRRRGPAAGERSAADWAAAGSGWQARSCPPGMVMAASSTLPAGRTERARSKQ